MNNKNIEREYYSNYLAENWDKKTDYNKLLDEMFSEREREERKKVLEHRSRILDKILKEDE